MSEWAAEHEGPARRRKSCRLRGIGQLVARKATVDELDDARATLGDPRVMRDHEERGAARVDERCAPATKTPLRPYWLMRERGPGVTEPLNAREGRVLSVATQDVFADGVRFTLRAMPSRGFVAHVGRDGGGGCTSRVDTKIAGVEARLVSVYIKEKLLGVDYVLLSGRTADGKSVQERVID